MPIVLKVLEIHAYRQRCLDDILEAGAEEGILDLALFGIGLAMCGSTPVAGRRLEGRNRIPENPLGRHAAERIPDRGRGGSARSKDTIHFTDGAPSL